MANEEHLAILRQGIEVWNAWREAHPDVRPDLSGADLRRINLAGANLAGANLEDVILHGVILGQTGQRGPIHYLLQRPNLKGTNFKRANLKRANLFGVSLERVNLQMADLQWTNLREADLREADLREADLKGAILERALLQRANLKGASLERALLHGADLTHAQVGTTSFGNILLREVHGLATLYHASPSTIGIDTLYRSQGHISEIFLRGRGIPDSMIDYAHALVTAERPIDYYSCFISYSSADQACAERLHADLQNKGVRCWFAPHDLEIGTPIVGGIDEAIRIYDKLLIILSESSVQSHWVAFEVSTALQRELEQGRTMLFPIRLDDAVLRTPSGWAAQLRSRHIGDVRGWKDHDTYQTAFGRLLRDLMAKEAGT